MNLRRWTAPIGEHVTVGAVAAILLACVAVPPQLVATSAVQSAAVPIPLDAAHWTATDSLRFEPHLGRPSLYIDRGVALARDVELADGVLEFSMAASPRSSFLGTVFHARAADFAEVVFFRVGQSGTSEAVQYAPAMNTLGAAWQVFHGPGANASAELPRERWIAVRIVLAGARASIYLDGACEPTLVVPRLAGTGGSQVGVWAGLFGRGAWFSDFRYTRTREADAAEPVALLPGTITGWELSPVMDAEALTPGSLSGLDRIEWEQVPTEPDGTVLINRFRTAPMASLPVNRETRQIYVDSLMRGRVSGSKVVLARAVVDGGEGGVRRLHFGYSDGVVIYANGAPLFFGMNPQFFQGDGIMRRAGDAIYVTLAPGRNEIIMAVTEFTGGWAFWARLEP